MTQRLTDRNTTARHMYYSGISVKDISEELDLPINELGLLIFGFDKTGNDPECWYRIKKDRNQNSFVTYRKVKGFLLSEAEAAIGQKVAISAVAISEDPAPLSLADTKIATEIMEKLDKMGRLERGEATEHVRVDQGMTLREIKNGVRIDAQDEEDDDTIEAEYSPIATPTTPSPLEIPSDNTIDKE